MAQKRKSKSKKKPAKQPELLDEKYKDYSKAKYPALNFSRQVSNRREYLDIDYLDQLNEEEKEFLNSFLSETVVTNFKHKGKKLYKKNKDKREFYQDNNRRNRCMLSKARATGSMLLYGNDPKGQQYFNHKLEEAFGLSDFSNDSEDAILTFLEMKNQGLVDNNGNVFIEVPDIKKTKKDV